MGDLQGGIDQLNFFVGDAHDPKTPTYRITTLHVQQVFVVLILKHRRVVEVRLPDEAHVIVIRKRWRRNSESRSQFAITAHRVGGASRGGFPLCTLVNVFFKFFCFDIHHFKFRTVPVKMPPFGR